MPRSLKPMLASLVDNIPPDEQNYYFEIKWDGVRALTYWDGRHLQIESRNQLDITHRYPELAALAKALSDYRIVLDGEIVALDENNRPSFPLLQRRMHVEDRISIPRLVKQVPIWYMVFDLLYLDGRSTMDLPFVQRREQLENLALHGPAWRVPPAHRGEGAAMLDAARQQHLEGIVAKKHDSIYEPGRRSPSWLKVKLVGRAEFVIGGWIPEGMTNKNRIGSLLVGYYEPSGETMKLRYAGGIGTGFDQQWHDRLTRLLKPLTRPTSPFADKVPKPGAIYVEPIIVAEVEYRCWPEGGILQQAAFKCLRDDRPAKDVVAKRVSTAGSNHNHSE